MADLASRVARLRVPLGFAFGAAALWLARPTWRSIAAGSVVALAGEAIRIWAAGHLEKGKEVTRSGPYRFTGHPLYLGSSLMGVGLAIAAGSVVVAILIATYLAIALTAAVRTEETWLRARFGDEYEAYRAARAGANDPRARGFSLARAIGNREYRAAAGLLAVIAALAWKAARVL